MCYDFIIFYLYCCDAVTKTSHFNTYHNENLGLHARKPVLGGVRPTKAQTSLRIRANWSTPLLFAFLKEPYLDLLHANFQFSS